MYSLYWYPPARMRVHVCACIWIFVDQDCDLAFQQISPGAWGLAQNITNSDQCVPILAWCCMCPKGSGKEIWLQCTYVYIYNLYINLYIYIFTYIHLRIPVSNQPTSLYLTHFQDEMIPPSHSRMLHARAEKSRWLLYISLGGLIRWLGSWSTLRKRN